MRIKSVDEDTVSVLTEDAYAKFMADAPEDGIPLTLGDARCTWVDALPRGKKSGALMLACVKKEAIRKAICKGWIHLALTEEYSEYNFGRGLDSVDDPVVEQLFKAAAAADENVGENVFLPAAKEWYSYHTIGAYVPAYNRTLVTGAAAAREKLGAVFSALSSGRGGLSRVLLEWVGVSGTYQVFYEYLVSGALNFPDEYRWKCLFGVRDVGNKPARNFDFRRAIEYLFYESVEQGFAMNTMGFVQNWADTLSMQEQIYGKIVDKYPENLLSVHQVLSYKSQLLQQQVNEEKWSGVSAEMEKHEKKGREYLILSPKTPNDMFDEARMQSNCLSSYIGRVADGECQIFFLRKRSAPDKSFVTIEIRGDGSLGQVLGRFNRRPPRDAIEYVESWWRDEFGSKLSEAV